MTENDALRQQAEATASANAASAPHPIEALSPQEVQATLHELRVHQIELEMQNEELRRTQLELEAARARYFDLYELAPVGYITVSEQGLILEANLTATTLLGIARSAARGVRAAPPIFSRFILKEDLALYYQRRKQILETGEPKSYELQMVKEDGTLFWAHLAATVAPAADGARVLRIVLTDITDRQQAEAAQHESEARYRQMFEQNQAVKLMIDPATGQILKANPAAARFYGYPLDTLQQLRISDLNLLDPAQIAANMQAALAEQRNYFVFSHRLASGEVRQVEVYSGPIDLNGQHVLYSIIHDITDRLRAEARLRRFWDLPIIGMALTSPDRRFLEVNQKLADMLGYSPAELVGVSWVDVTHPDDVAENVRLLAQTLAGQTDEYSADKRFIRRDGVWLYAHIAARCIRRLDGTVDHLALVVQDITARKRAEERISQLANELQVTLDTVTAGISHIKNRKIEWANAAHAEMFGYASGETLGISTDVFYPDRASFERLGQTAYPQLAAGKTFSAEMEMQKKDGTRFWCSLIGRAVSVENPAEGAIWMIQDITDRKQAETARRESEERLREVLENSLDASYKRNVQTNDYDYLSPAFARLSGYTPAEMKTLPIETVLDLIHPDDRAGIEHVIAESRSGLAGATYQMDYRFKHKAGQYRWLHDQFTVMQDAAGQPAALIGSVSDITDRKQAEAALRQSETLLRTLIDTLPERIFAKDTHSRFTLANATEIRLDGATSFEELRGKSDFDFYPIDLAQQYYDAEQPILIEGQSLIGREERSIDQAGQTRWHISTKVPLRDADDHISGLVGMTMDITERKHAEATQRIQHDLNLALGSSDDLRQALALILEAALRLDSIDCGGIYLTDQSGALDLIVHRGLASQFIAQAMHYPADAPQARLARTGQPRYGAYQSIQSEPTAARALEGLHALAVLPVIHQGQLLAALNLASHTRDDIPINTRHALETLAGQIGSILMRLRADTALRESRQNLQTLFDAVDDFLFVLDGTGHILQTNAVTRNRLGYTTEELVGQDVLMVHPPARRTEAAAIIADMLAGRRDFCPVPIQARDGTLIPVETRVTPGTWSGQPALFGLSRDITVRNRAEEALRESEEKFRAIIEQSNDGIILIDELGDVLEWNRAQEQLTGILRTEALGQPAWDIQLRQVLTAHRTQLTAERLKQTILKMLETGQSPQFNRSIEIQTQMASGEPRTILQNAFPIKKGPGYRLGIILHDITERKQSEAALQKVSGQLTRVIESSSDVIAMMDTGYHYILFNSAFHEEFKKIFGQDLKPGNSMPEALAHLPNDLADAMNHWNRALGGEDFTVEQQFGDTQLERNWYELHFSPIRDADGKVIGAVHIVHNTTDRKQAEAALRELNATLEQRVADRTADLLATNERLTELDHMKDEFMSRMGHELRMPLANLKLYLTLLERGLPEKRAEYLQTLQREQQRLNTLIEDVLTITELSQNALDMEMGQTDLNQALLPHLAAWRALATGRALAFHTDLATPLPLAWLDTLRMPQAITLLIHNAVSYTPTGSVTLATRASADESDQWLTVSVTDTGPGITPVDLPHIFERFYRGRAAANYKTPGTGVGLSIGLQIARQMGGRLTVATQVGVGSTFTLWLRSAAR